LEREVAVIGRRALPEAFVEFNSTWGVPFGKPAAIAVSLRQRHQAPTADYGPFAFQVPSGTRIFEYPWCVSALDTFPGCRVLDVGGCVSGLQFVLAQQGCRVVNVDPFEDGTDGWPMDYYTVTPELHERLNEAFGTGVELVTKRLADAGLAAGSFDRVLCLSVLEHLPQNEGQELLAAAGRLLAPGGLLVATIDLFLDVEPFGVLKRNGFGTNVDVAALVAHSGLHLVGGDPRELHGFAEFDPDSIVAHLDELLLPKTYPVLTQALVLRKAT
jgi:SAM-dependent methyltransferase